VVPYSTYEEVFDLEELPHRLLVLGGGPIGVELAQAFAHLGSEVTLAEKEGRLLPMADREASDILTRRLAADGVRVETGLKLEKVLWGDGKVTADSARGRLTADLLLVATGRRPDVEGLQLARAGVAYDHHGIRVDQKLKTSQDHIYAAGDVTGSFPVHALRGLAGLRGGAERTLCRLDPRRGQYGSMGGLHPAGAGAGRPHRGAGSRAGPEDGRAPPASRAR
jgi:pyruvate/2-oxoglutarate dehydrogenase complex dihydrolipoamide dehydrogenase (E3) component